MQGKQPFSAMVRRFILAMAIVLSGVIAAPVLAQDGVDGWKLDPFARVEVGIVTAESSDREDELIVNGDGGYLRAQIGVELRNDRTEIRLEADRIEVERFGSATGRDGFNRDRLTATITQELNDDWELQLRGRIYDDLVTVESADTDEVQIATRVEYEPERAHRFRLQAAWREREYDDGEGPGGTASEGDGLRIDAGYRHRLGRYHYINFDLRAEEINSDNARRRYTRESVSASYTHPITSDIRVRPAMQVRTTRFEGRLTPAGEAREDTQIVPEVEVLWWPNNWRVEAEAKYIFSDSNDPVRNREGYRLSLTVGYVF